MWQLTDNPSALSMTTDAIRADAPLAVTQGAIGKR
jgi:hypothetical protein